MVRSASQLWAVGSSLLPQSPLCLLTPSGCPSPLPFSLFPPFSPVTLPAPTQAHTLPQGQDTDPTFLKIVLARQNEYWPAKTAQESTKTTLKPIQSLPINRTTKHDVFGN